MRKENLVFIASIILFILINIGLVQAGSATVYVKYQDSCPRSNAFVYTYDPLTQGIGTTNESGIARCNSCLPDDDYLIRAQYPDNGPYFGQYEVLVSRPNGVATITSTAEYGGLILDNDTNGVGDCHQPQWRNQGQNQSSIIKGNTNLLYAQAKSYKVGWAWLATNEKGYWDNITYMNISNGSVTNWVWSNFTWSNTSFTGTLSWKIYYNDSYNGFTNVTNENSFTVLRPSCNNTITSCGCNLDSGITYTLANDISTTSGTCLEMTAGSAILNCNGHKISGVRDSGSIGINLKNTVEVIDHCNITNFENGILYDIGYDASSSIIRYNNIYGNNRGIFLSNSVTSGFWIHSNRIFNNSIRGIVIVACSGNDIYNNFFNNSINADDDSSNNWNTAKTLGTNIIGGPYIGGNYWTNPTSNGYSDTCTDGDKDGFCDTPYNIPGGHPNYDNLPLAVKTCGLSTNNIDFGSVNTGETSLEQTATITNTGNSNTTTLTIKGNDWTPSMPVGQTHWLLTSGQNYDSMTALTETDSTLGQQVSPGSPLPVYFKLKIPNGQAATSYTQVITFTGSC